MVYTAYLACVILINISDVEYTVTLYVLNFRYSLQFKLSKDPPGNMPTKLCSVLECIIQRASTRI